MSPHEAPLSAQQDEPVFAAPWEAEAFALAVSLNQHGAFGWDEWAKALAAEIHRPGDHAADRTYYQDWLAALERLAVDKKLVTPAELAARRDAWDRATQATPHRQPILLENDPLAGRGEGG